MKIALLKCGDVDPDLLHIHGDYDDMFDFQKDNVIPYFEPVKNLISAVEKLIAESLGHFGSAQ